MRRTPAVVLGLLLPVAASAQPAPVIGGNDAPAGKWPDVAAMYYPDGQQGCTGTLIAPTVVLTAGHCIYDGGPSAVLVGTNSLARRGDGDFLPVTKRVEYPSSQSSYDVAVIVLGQASRFAPRAIATGWARVDIKDGAQVAIAGYGAVDRDANEYINELQEATTTITDAGCVRSAGCNSAARPAGELGAGGMGIDTCPGDSGGPLYLTTSYGSFLAGVTSRGYYDNAYYCSEGGIYGRPDKIVDWIEQQAGAKVSRGPEPIFEPLAAVRGHAAETQIEPNDPLSEQHTYAITTPPTKGTAAMTTDGRVRVCTDPAMAGTDSMVVTITDATKPDRALAVTLPITIGDGAPADSCDPTAFESTDGGCCDSGRSADGSIVLGIGLAAVLRRRRRR
ncbi:MAG TPA: trypsin-like serine protease [Kofleriaceae bacterium]|jgi:endonuclease G|nr:trypsin-like serine protease [Kofleriaceae bacterium]